MMIRWASVLTVIACVATASADEFKSGPPAGAEVPGAFRPLNVNGSAAGERSCLYCRNGEKPAVMIFARQVSAPLTDLIQKLDAAAEKYKDAQVGSFVIFLGTRDKLEPTLKELDQKLRLKHTVLAIDTPQGPEAYEISPQADVTAVLYNDYKVEANHAVRKGKLDDKTADKILGDLPRILPKK